MERLIADSKLIPVKELETQIAEAKETLASLEAEKRIAENPDAPGLVGRYFKNIVQEGDEKIVAQNYVKINEAKDERGVFLVKHEGFMFKDGSFFWDCDGFSSPDKFLDGKMYEEIKEADYQEALDKALNTIKGI
jgi:hypothetical protein